MMIPLMWWYSWRWGLVGSLLLGVFASKAVNPGGADGLLAGNTAQLVSQMMGVFGVGVYAFVVSWILIKILHATLGMRLTEENEVQGMDYSEHSETAIINRR